MPGVLAVEDLVARGRRCHPRRRRQMPGVLAVEDLVAEPVEGGAMPSVPTLEDVFGEAVGEG